MINHLIYFNWQLRKPHFGLIMGHLDKLLEDYNNSVTFLYCTGNLKPCYSNRLADANVCKLCKFNSNVAFSSYKERVNFVKIDDLLPQKKSFKFEYSSVEELKEINYNNINIGFPAFSSYVSFSLNLDPEINEEFRNYMDTLLYNEVMLLEKISMYFDTNQTDHLTIFNGRTADVRPIFESAIARKIPVTALELIKETDTEFWKEEFHNALPHDISFFHTRMVNLWNRKDISQEIKIQEGESFYKRRREGVLTRDVKVYTDGQKIGKLPKSWSNENKNIIVFLSSENEFAGIGDIWNKLSIFESQEKALHWIGKNYNEEKVKIYIRIHPNLEQVKYGYHLRLFDLPKFYPHFEVIPADSKVSSYTLIDNSEKVVAFGSSIGIEATYWKKPSIQLCGSLYYYLDATYKPKTKAEFLHLLGSKLEPLDSKEAIKYGFHLMSIKNYAVKCKYSPVPVTLLWVKFGLSMEYLKLLNSIFIFKLIEIILSKLYRDRSRYLRIPPIEASKLS